MRAGRSGVLKRYHVECLELVASGLTSKEIAQRLDLSPATVDTYIKQAMSLLGAKTRTEAVTLLRENGAFPKLGSPPRDIAEPFQSGSFGPAATGGSDRKIPANPVPPIGGKRNELSKAERVRSIVLLAFVCSAIVIATAILIRGALNAFS